MYVLLIILLVIASFPALAQDQVKIPFVPFVVDELKYEQVDQAMSKISMPRDAHIAFQRLWIELENQARESAKIKPSK